MTNLKDNLSQLCLNMFKIQATGVWASETLTIKMKPPQTLRHFGNSLTHWHTILSEQHIEWTCVAGGFWKCITYYSIRLTAQSRPNYTSHFVKVPFSPSVPCMGAEAQRCTHTTTAAFQTTDRQTDKGRSRYIFPSGCTFVYKNS